MTMAITTLNINVDVPSDKINLSELKHQVTMYAQLVASRLANMQIKKGDTLSDSSDEMFFKTFLSLPLDESISAKEEERLIRSSHYYSADRAVDHLYEGK